MSEVVKKTRTKKQIMTEILKNFGGAVLVSLFCFMVGLIPIGFMLAAAGLEWLQTGAFVKFFRLYSNGTFLWVWIGATITAVICIPIYERIFKRAGTHE
jgi:hypothetical protein